MSGQELTPDKFVVTATYKDGSTRILEDGTNGGVRDSETITITSPNWPNNYPKNMTEEENTWEYTFESTIGIQVTFDETSSLAYEERGQCAFCDTNSKIIIYSKNSKLSKTQCCDLFSI